MLKIYKSLIAVLFITMSITSVVNASTTIKINDLIENTSFWNEKKVTVNGEAIGEIMERGEYAWVNISDGTNAIGVWIKLEDAKKITRFGDYKNIGDTVEITGIFYRACTEHGGDVDIHCSDIQIVKKGYAQKEEVKSNKIIIASLLSVITLFFVYIYFKMNPIIRKP